MTSLSFTDNFFLSTSFVVWITQVPGRLTDNRRQWTRSFLFACFQEDIYIYISRIIYWKRKKAEFVNLNFYARKKNNFPKLINKFLDSFRNHPSHLVFFSYLFYNLRFTIFFLFIFKFPLFLLFYVFFF